MYLHSSIEYQITAYSRPVRLRLYCTKLTFLLTIGLCFCCFFESDLDHVQLVSAPDFDIIFDSALQLDTSTPAKSALISGIGLKCRTHKLLNTWQMYYIRLFTIDVNVILTFYCLRRRRFWHATHGCLQKCRKGIYDVQL